MTEVWTVISNDVDDSPRETDRTLPCGVNESCRMHHYRWVRVGCVFGQLSRGAEKCPTSFVVLVMQELTPS